MIVDTNVLLRAAIVDDALQTEQARQCLREAAQIFVPTIALCEFVWVARRFYRMSSAEVAHAIRLLVADRKVVFDRAAVEAGLSLLEAGGDFADGVIAFEGRRLGGEIFATFDRKAAVVLEKAGQECLSLSDQPAGH
jgi:predicted nucleic-acid-binding protein